MTVDVLTDPGPAPVIEPAPTTVAAGPRLAHEPALDGLRGLAVAVVVLFHLDRLQGGFLGVDLFFVLSGYLITSLLVAEHRRMGTIGLGGFWARRARRLLPALFAVLVGVALLLLWFTPEAQRSAFRGDALATLGYVANWHRMGATAGYWDMFNQPSPLDHMWSLAIEEQFYLVWPIVAVLVLRLRRSSVAGLGVLALVGAAVSFGLLAWAYEPADTNRAYFATDTRLGPTLLGAGLAVFVAGRLRRDTPPTAGREGLGLLALAWMAWSVWQVDGLGSWYYQGGLVAFAVAAIVAVACFTGGPPGRVTRVLACPPLRWLGTVSYGVYLWHWPVIVYLTADRAHVDGVVLDVLRVALTLALAAASYAWIERPLRRGSFPPVRLRIVGVGAAAMTLVAVVVGTSGPPQEAEQPDGVIVAGEATDAAFDESSKWVRDHRHLPRDVPAGTTKLLLVGDSAVANVGPSFRRLGEESGYSVGFSSEGFCSVILPGGDSLAPSGDLWHRNDVCTEDRRAIWRAMIERFDPDVVIHYLANGGTGYKQRLDGEWVADCDEPYDAFLRDGLSEDIELLGAGGARVLFATTPYASRDPESQADANVEVDCRNATYEAVVEAHPGTEMVDLNAYIEQERARAGTDLFRDNVHPDDQGIALMSAWFLATATG